MTDEHSYAWWSELGSVIEQLRRLDRTDIADQWLVVNLASCSSSAIQSDVDAFRFRHRPSSLGSVRRTTEDFLAKTMALISRIASLPEHVASYFKHPSAAYAAQGI